MGAIKRYPGDNLTVTWSTRGEGDNYFIIIRCDRLNAARTTNVLYCAHISISIRSESVLRMAFVVDLRFSSNNPRAESVRAIGFYIRNVRLTDAGL